MHEAPVGERACISTGRRLLPFEDVATTCQRGLVLGGEKARRSRALLQTTVGVSPISQSPFGMPQ